MDRGPVGSLEIPESPAEHERVDADGVTVYIHRDALMGLVDPGRLSFAFGSFGRCWLQLETGAGPLPRGGG